VRLHQQHVNVAQRAFLETALAIAAQALFVAGPARWIDTARALGVTQALLVDTEDGLRVTSALAPRVAMTDGQLQAIVDPL